MKYYPANYPVFLKEKYKNIWQKKTIFLMMLKALKRTIKEEYFVSMNQINSFIELVDEIKQELSSIKAALLIEGVIE